MIELCGEFKAIDEILLDGDDGVTSVPGAD
jgi:hypothetical protein